MDLLNQSTGSDDEDLECLRLAALKTLKKSSNNVNFVNNGGNLSGGSNYVVNTISLVPETHQKSMKAQRPTFGSAHPTRHHGRGFRGGGNRQGRNGAFPRSRTNTNLISIQTIDSTEEDLLSTVKDTSQKPDIPKLVLPQDRYHKTVESETESSRETNKFDRYEQSDDSESDSEAEPKRFRREDSLERLMKELKDTINENDNEPDNASGNTDDKKDEIDDVLTLESGETDLLNEIDEIDDPEPKKITPKKRKSPSPIRKRISRTRSRTRSRSRSRPRYSPPRKPTSYRPLSPLVINPDIISAPLSPRSAAFVMQNREILARRIRSPSPRRSPSPKRRRRSRSPYNKRSLSPRGLSPICPVRRRSISPKSRTFRRSPVRGNSPFRRSRSPGSRYSRRAGNHKKLSPLPPKDRKPDSPKRRQRSPTLSLSPSPERTYNRHPLNGLPPAHKQKSPTPPKPSEPLDPVLEARRRKFEKPIIPAPGRVIKLKQDKPPELENTQQKTEIKTENKPEIDKDDLSDIDFEDDLDDFDNNGDESCIDLNPTVDDLWSDEESDDENEGRFKSSSNTRKRNITYIPFSKLTEKPKPTTTTGNKRDETRRKERKERKHRRDKPQKEKPAPQVDKTIEVKSKINLIPEVEKKKEEKKEEVRRVKVQKIVEPEKLSPEIKKKDELDIDTDIIIEDDGNDDDCDLRAELSRRRAQRKLAEGMPTRLLKSALNEVGVKRTGKRTKIEKEREGPTKLPIRMRLGLTGVTNEETSPPPRRSKKLRSNRRKRLVQV